MVIWAGTRSVQIEGSEVNRLIILVERRNNQKRYEADRWTTIPNPEPSLGKGFKALNSDYNIVHSDTKTSQGAPMGFSDPIYYSC